MEYNSTTGAWLKVDDTLDGKKAKLISECIMVESRFKDEKTGGPKTENQVKVQFEHLVEPINARLNWTTINGLKEAFGRESKNWIAHPLTAKVKDATTGQSLYLIPGGFELYRNEEKRWAIRKQAVEQTLDDGAPLPEEE